MEGMTLMIKEGQRIFHPKPPKRFPSCGDFTWSLDEYKEITDAGIAVLGNENNSTDNNGKKKICHENNSISKSIIVIFFKDIDGNCNFKIINKHKVCMYG